MPKKIVALADYISASDAAALLREKLRRPISNKYIRKLSERKRAPVRTQPMGNRLLYNREDIAATTIRLKRHMTIAGQRKGAAPESGAM